ncbi:hormogonium polysaccharide biosynthesis protein HpsJ [Baaleninema sp.]|uniref:hormogonium polysaccharide biosynthesis protein HpsJ n=1 Tax=Baaleninema sp. TaxID=3101197 RepID=UPI003CFF2BBE
MKASTTRQPSSLAARSLKIVGLLLIVSSLLDYLIIPAPYQPLNLQWRIQVASTFVDRGIIPMIGIALLFAGYWMGTAGAATAMPRKKWQDLRFWGLVLSSLLGLLFLLMTGIHFNDVRMQSNQRLESIAQQARQAETQLNTQLSSEEFQTQLEQQRTQLEQQLETLLENEAQRQQLIESEQTPDALRQLLEESQDNPDAIQSFLDRQASQLPEQLQGRIRQREEQLEQETRLAAWKSAFRIGLSSLLLAIGYIVIGWTGLKGMMRPRRGGRKVPSSN